MAQARNLNRPTKEDYVQKAMQPSRPPAVSASWLSQMGQKSFNTARPGMSPAALAFAQAGNKVPVPAIVPTRRDDSSVLAAAVGAAAAQPAAQPGTPDHRNAVVSSMDQGRKAAEAAAAAAAAKPMTVEEASNAWVMQNLQQRLTADQARVVLSGVPQQGRPSLADTSRQEIGDELFKELGRRASVISKEVLTKKKTSEEAAAENLQNWNEYIARRMSMYGANPLNQANAGIMSYGQTLEGR